MKKLWMPALIAGLAGGLAEMAWVAFYSAWSPVSAAEVARGIAATVVAGAAGAPWAPWAGVGIHLALSLALGAAFVLALWTLSPGRPGSRLVWSGAIATAVTVWAVNFLLVLPSLNAAFVTLLPYGVTLLSKTLFGVAMAATLQMAYRRS
jgi:hypothetical protein